MMIRLIDRIAVVALWAVAGLGWALFWFGLAALIFYIVTLK